MQEGCRGVDRLDAFPVFAGHVDDQLVDDDPGVVHQNVQSTERLDGQTDRALGGAIFGDVGHQWH
ncbi:hypothetical protein D3C75_1318120 [compost metagenome]